MVAKKEQPATRSDKCPAVKKNGRAPTLYERRLYQVWCCSARCKDECLPQHSSQNSCCEVNLCRDCACQDCDVTSHGVCSAMWLRSSLQLHAQLLLFRQVCSAIPCGKVSTYGALAKALRSSPRAVGQARQRLVLLLTEFRHSN